MLSKYILLITYEMSDIVQLDVIVQSAAFIVLFSLLQPGRPGCSIHTSLYANRGYFDGRSSLDV